jgi:hypothetical protein
MRRELEEIVARIEARAQARPTAMEFEMAYQARIAIDRIRFAITNTQNSSRSILIQCARQVYSCWMRLSDLKLWIAGSSDDQHPGSRKARKTA